MSNDIFKGYRGVTREMMEKLGIKVWDDVILTAGPNVFQGVVLPRSETADADHIVLKLATGYNIGVSATKVTSVEILGSREAHYQIPEQAFPYDEKNPRVKLLGTGGTIASRLDYKTGAVIPAFSSRRPNVTRSNAATTSDRWTRFTASRA